MDACLGFLLPLLGPLADLSYGILVQIRLTVATLVEGSLTAFRRELKKRICTPEANDLRVVEVPSQTSWKIELHHVSIVAKLNMYIYAYKLQHINKAITYYDAVDNLSSG